MTSALYASLLTLAVTLAWQSRETAFQKLAAWMSVGWLVTTISSYAVGAHYTAWSSLVIDVVVTANLAIVSTRYNIWVGWAIVACYAVSSVIASTAFAGGSEGQPAYWAAENAAFVLRLLILGGASAASLVARLRPVPAIARRHFTHREVG